MQILRSGAVVLALGAAACDDHVHRPCGEYTDDWHGVKCFLETNCTSCHSEQHDLSGDGEITYYYGNNFEVVWTGDIATVLPDAVNNDVRNDWGYYVVKGDSERSRLWWMLTHSAPADESFIPMPWLSEPLPPSETEHVKRWIDAGAPME